MHHRYVGINWRTYDIINDKGKGLFWECLDYIQKEINLSKLRLQTKNDFSKISKRVRGELNKDFASGVIDNNSEICLSLIVRRIESVTVSNKEVVLQPCLNP